MFHEHLSFPVGPLDHPVVGHISHKSGAEDQDDGKTKEEDGVHIPFVHHGVLVITMEVWVLRVDVFVLGLWVLHPLLGRFSLLLLLSSHSGPGDHSPRGGARFPANVGSLEPPNSQKAAGTQT